MLTEILSKETCANCKICCIFNKDDIWEAPVISNELRTKILELKPEQEFISKGNSYILSMQKSDNGLFYCTMLGENGCILGEDKPFDCRIWPFRIMNFEGKHVITLSPLCTSVFGKSLEELISFLNKGLASQIFQEAECNPDIIKDYIKGYPILCVE